MNTEEITGIICALQGAVSICLAELSIEPEDKDDLIALLEKLRADLSAQSRLGNVAREAAAATLDRFMEVVSRSPAKGS